VAGHRQLLPATDAHPLDGRDHGLFRALDRVEHSLPVLHDLEDLFRGGQFGHFLQVHAGDKNIGNPADDHQNLGLRVAPQIRNFLLKLVQKLAVERIHRRPVDL
jgi:hypothetical protein